MDKHLLHCPVYEYPESPVLGGRIYPCLDRVVTGGVLWADICRCGAHHRVAGTVILYRSLVLSDDLLRIIVAHIRRCRD